MNKTGIRAALAVAALAAIWGCGGGGSEIKVVVNDQGFVPSKIQVKKGQDVTLVVTRETDLTCATEIVVAAKGIHQDLPLNQTVRVPLGKVDSDSLRFACGMDMIIAVSHAAQLHRGRWERPSASPAITSPAAGASAGAAASLSGSFQIERKYFLDNVLRPYRQKAN
jgi:hypothetical protein